jgi:hypothetical protein
MVEVLWQTYRFVDHRGYILENADRYDIPSVSRSRSAGERRFQPQGRQQDLGSVDRGLSS